MKEARNDSPLVPLPEEPSAAWGWHGGFPRGSLIAGWVTAVVFVAIVITRFASGHSEGHVADVYLLAIAAGLVLLLIRHSVRTRHCR